jgi:hypothetical protein
MNFRAYILFFLTLLTGLQISAQKIHFTAVAPAAVQIGQQFQYTVEGNEKGKVIVPTVKGIELLGGPYTSYSSSTQWVNGRMTAHVSNTYTYVMRANEAGEITFPPSIVKLKKSEYKTNEVIIHVVGSASSGNPGSNNTTAVNSQEGTQTSTASDQVYLRIFPSKKEVYVGEQLVSELKIYTRVDTRPTGGMKDVPYEGFYKHVLDPDQNSAREVINGEQYITQVLQRHVLIPQKSGKMVIAPYESEWTIPNRTQRRGSGNTMDDFFNDPFFNSVRNVPTKILTKPVTLKVKPFPDGAPKGFTGGVGSLKMTARLSAESVEENDALSLIITVSGTGNISLLGAPKVDFPPDHDVYETTRKEKISTSSNRVTGSVTFEYPMVARHAGNFRISPISFTWFDPAIKEYKSLATDEFNFTVLKGEDGDTAGQVYMPGMRAEDVENIGTDILDIQRTSSDLSKIGYTPLSKSWYWIIYLAFLVLFLLSGGLLRIYFRQRADVRLVRNRKANKLAKRRLKTADKARKSSKAELFFEETDKAMWGYLGDKLGLELSSLRRDKVIEILENKSVEEEVSIELFRIMDECEFSRYAPSEEKSDMNSLYNDAIKLINKLEQNIQ